MRILVLVTFLMFFTLRVHPQDTAINFIILYNKEVVNESYINKMFFINTNDSSRFEAEYTFGKIKVSAKDFETILMKEAKFFRLEFEIWTQGNVIELLRYPLDILPIANKKNYAILLNIEVIKNSNKEKCFFKTEIYTSSGSLTFISDISIACGVRQKKKQKRKP